MSDADQKQTLKRTMNTPILILYGMGTMVGGGIYALLGKVVGEAGFLSPFVFLIAAIIAFLTALSYMQLSALYPVCAGPATYVVKAFRKAWLGALIGLLVIFTGLSSASTLTKAGAGFIFDLTGWPEMAASLVILVPLGMIAYRGIGLSAAFIAFITAIEVLGLLAIIAINHGAFLDIGSYLSAVQSTVSMAMSAQDFSFWIMIASTSFLAFYAFIGFEDMVNVVEEVKKPRQTMPKAILGAFLMTSLLYFAIAYIATVSVSAEAMAMAKTPLALLVGGESDGASWLSPTTMGLISIVAGVNGALVQWIMISRVLYGLKNSMEGHFLARFFAPFQKLHPTYATPTRAIALTGLIIFVLANYFPLTSLASAASGIILLVFVGVNGALLWLGVKVRLGLDDKKPLEGEDVNTSRLKGSFLSLLLPAAGACLSAALLIFSFMSH